MDNTADGLKYVKGVPHEYFNCHGEGLPATYAMLWSLIATGVSRLFTREDMKEFLFRLPLALNSVDLVETWLIKDRLMPYKHREREYVLKLEDVIMHFGLEASDHYKNFSDREEYLKEISSGINAAMIIGCFGDFSVTEPEKSENFWEMFRPLEPQPEPTPKLIAKAGFFANDLMRFIPDETFKDRKPEIINKEAELAARVERIKNLPEFDIQKVPTEIIRKCLEIMYKEDYVNYLSEKTEEFYRKAEPNIYLAWLIANDFMEMDGPSTHEKEGIELNYMDYVRKGGLFNLGETIEMYNLDEMDQLLKGLFIK